MNIQTSRLLVRDLRDEDAIPLAEMASDGSLRDIGFDQDCGSWMADWIREAKALAEADNPNTEYLAYTIILKSDGKVIGSVGCSYYEDLRQTGITYFIGTKYRNNGYAAEAVKAYAAHFLQHYRASKLIATVREENIPSWKTVEKAGFVLTEKKMYQDLNDEKEEPYRFYECAAAH